MPGFTEHDGRLFVRFIPQYILASQRHPDAPRLNATAREAIAAVSALANDPDFNVYMDLQPGEMQFINNYHVLHGRTAYEDDVALGYKRHLKRLWLATHALTDRPAHFAALGAPPLGGTAFGQHAAAGRALRRPARPTPGSGPPDPGLSPARTSSCRENRRRRVLMSMVPSMKEAGKRALAQDPDRRHGRVDQRRGRRRRAVRRRRRGPRPPDRRPGRPRRAALKLSGTVRQGPCSRQSRRRTRPSGMPTTAAHTPGPPPAASGPIGGRLDPGQEHLDRAGPAPLEQAAELVGPARRQRAHGVGVTDRVVRARRGRRPAPPAAPRPSGDPARTARL